MRAAKTNDPSPPPRGDRYALTPNPAFPAADGDPPPPEPSRPGEARRERRSGRDRRKGGLPALLRGLQGGRRRFLRREEDRRRVTLLDRYDARIAARALGVLALSLIDAVLTLYLIGHGAWEMNPVMAHFLARGPLAFVVAKVLFTGIAVAIFVVVSPAILPGLGIRAGHFLPAALVAFAAVIAWEVVLLVRLHAHATPGG